ncbi:L-threonylcarbamoyladenylate synthase [Siphonobacter sp. SORGH_AS_1065]|uniref:L-threonylcarbamoyladenylate synthase n=1 Tax=Siphonobacter sp. SORGH_AS_1065 TaxID=3041795 RepID=UPI0027801612|nr:L-threonylcarbamoyladenylate synthase [Siphonobacter sp. SORGH_AS_1065]MDQ1087041.1 L-threonylcarbamoyladenylate synthase [Siphonobacter sp. SORGH_AS_1065]
MIGTDLQRAKELLEAGALVGIPTETVYGLAGNALNEEAVLSIFRVKNRPAFDPLIIHTNSFERLQEFVRDIPEKALLLAEKLTPGPLTFLLPKAPQIPDLVTSGLDTVAVRIPQHALTRSLLEQLPFPLAAPSANPFGYISPTTAEHVEQQLGDKIPYILDGGPCEIGVESTIVGFEGDDVIVYRKGGTPIEAIEALIGTVEVRAHSSSNPQAPGMLKSHYAPRTPLSIHEELETLPPSDRIGILGFQTDYGFIHQEILSPAGDYAEAARQLFAAMRRLDALDLDHIYAELLPEQDLGVAINDRIRRAAAL